MPDDGPTSTDATGALSAGVAAPLTGDPATGETAPAWNAPAWNAPAGNAPAADGHLCPWCSADLADQAPERCPACGARLTEDPDASIPGVTTVDPAAVRRAARWQPAPKRRLLGFLDSQPAEESGVRPSSVEALAPPSAEVRLEMERLRAELDAAAAAELDAAAATEAAEAELIAAEMRTARTAAEAATAPDHTAPPVP